MELEGEVFIAPPILDVLLRLHVLSYMFAPFLVSLAGAAAQTKGGSLSIGSRLMLDPHILGLLVQAHFVVVI